MITRTPRIPLKKQKALLQCFIKDLSASEAGNCSKVRYGKKTVVKGVVDVSRICVNRYYRYYREAIYQATRRAPRFFGEVEMDQTEFGGRGSKRIKSLLSRYKKTLTYEEYRTKAKALRAEHKILVFGILQRGGDVYAHIIKRADARTLTPLVRLVVEPGATLYTDQWRGFTELKVDGYTHHSINHSLEYTTKDGHHANGIESFWSFAKRRTTKFNGLHSTTFPLHLKECEFRYNHPHDLEKALKALLK